jgi:DNA polymerase-3 subunit gamma/tau
VVVSEPARVPETVPAPQEETAAPVESAAAKPAKPVGPVTLQQMRDAWPEVLSSLQRTKRSAWMVAFTAQVRDFRDGDVLVLAFPSEHDVAGFRGGAPGQSVSELLRGAIVEVLGVRVKFVARVDGSGGAPVGASGGAPVGGPPVAAPPAPVTPQAPVAPTAPPAEVRSAPSPRSTAPAAPSQAASDAPVDSWATVAIPRDPSEADGAGAESAQSSGRTATALAERPESAPSAGIGEAPVARPAAAVHVDAGELPDDADAPPEDEEPPFDPGPEPELIVEASASAAAIATGSTAHAAPAARAARAHEHARRPVSTASGDGFQRYGEAVVREVLGATFLEEVEAPQRPGFGERG